MGEEYVEETHKGDTQSSLVTASKAVCKKVRASKAARKVLAFEETLKEPSLNDIISAFPESFQHAFTTLTESVPLHEWEDTLRLFLATRDASCIQDATVVSSLPIL